MPVKSEKESRANLLSHAREHGAETELLKIFARFDDLLKGAKSKEEKDAIAAMGVLEIDRFFSGSFKSERELIINGKKY